MAFKPNYRLQRAEKNRAKQAKMDEKLRQQQERTAARKAAKDAGEAKKEIEGHNT